MFRLMSAEGPEHIFVLTSLWVAKHKVPVLSGGWIFCPSHQLKLDCNAVMCVNFYLLSKQSELRHCRPYAGAFKCDNYLEARTLLFRRQVYSFTSSVSGDHCKVFQLEHCKVHSCMQSCSHTCNDSVTLASCTRHKCSTLLYPCCIVPISAEHLPLSRLWMVSPVSNLIIMCVWTGLQHFLSHISLASERCRVIGENSMSTDKNTGGATGHASALYADIQIYTKK